MKAIRIRRCNNRLFQDTDISCQSTFWVQYAGASAKTNPSRAYIRPVTGASIGAAMSINDSTARYCAHIRDLNRHYEQGLEHAGLAAVVIGAGNPRAYFMDDQRVPFRPCPHFAQWGPLQEHPGSVMIVRAGSQPELLVYAPIDYWHQIPAIPVQFGEAGIQVQTVHNPESIKQHIATITGKTAFLGEVVESGDNFGIERVNPPDLIEHLHEGRTRKSEWELESLRKASEIAVRGHIAAEQSFQAGGSEYEIQTAYRTACQVTDNEMPYPAIVAINSNAAALHYQRLERQRGNNLSLLIDAGHAVNGYASDITRTYSEDPAFGALVEAMHELQQQLCANAMPGTDYCELHNAAHIGIAELLQEAEVITMDSSDAVAAGISKVFFPHGLGHFLGLQVHDVGALYTRRNPDEKTQLGEHPHLRLTRVLEPGNVLTIEPGLYFINSLLNELRSGPESRYINWARVKQLSPFGGIRIEDNIHITATGNENLTRNAFAQFCLPG